MRTLLIFIALAVIVMIIKRLWGQTIQKPASRTETEKMVQCANCGIYVPLHEALEQQGKYYCSSAHRDAAGRNP